MAHAGGKTFHLPPQVPIGSFVRQATGIAIAHGEGGKGRHDALAFLVTLGTGGRQGSIPYRTKILEYAIAVSAVVLIKGHGTPPYSASFFSSTGAMVRWNLGGLL